LSNPVSVPLNVRELPDSLCAKTATQLGTLLRAFEITAEDLIAAHLDRIDVVNSQVNALVTVNADAAIDRGRELDAMAAKGQFAGPLHGIPIAIKDIFPTAGLRTTYGSRVFADNVPTHDAIHVARLRNAGAIIIGKSNTAEFAYGAQTTNPLFGLTRNPFNLHKTVSGSSGGATASLAAGLSVLADGSDLGGSIRAPAGFAGVVGLRPTSRIVPLEGAALPFDGLNVPGPMGRSVSDVRLMLDAMAGASPLDPLSQGVLPDDDKPLSPDLDGLKLAWCMTPGGAPIHPDVAAALEPAYALLTGLGASVREADPAIGEMVAAQQVFRDWSARAELQELASNHHDDFGVEIQRTLSRANALTVSDLLNAEATRRRAWLKMLDFLKTHDMCVWPTNSQLAYSAEVDVASLELNETPTLVTPALGLPAISIPFGQTPDGITTGLQLIGPRYSDKRLLDVAQVLLDRARNNSSSLF